jgi:hypothetical protein
MNVAQRKGAAKYNRPKALSPLRLGAFGATLVVVHNACGECLQRAMPELRAIPSNEGTQSR